MSNSTPHPAYMSVAHSVSAEQVVKKSRFIADVFPVSDEVEVLAALKAVRSRHPGANHICYAYKCGLGTETVRFSDAGEPSGTAGRPILEVVEREGLRNTLVIVTRYFGGILLGAAGLVRAYAGAAAAGIAAAGKARYEWHVMYRVTVDYTAWGRVERLLRDQGIAVLAPEFGAAVSCSCHIPATDAVGWLAKLQDATGGRIEAHITAEGYRPVTFPT